MGLRAFLRAPLGESPCRGQIGHQLFELLVLLLQLSQPPNLGDCHLTVAFPPDIVGRFTDPQLASHLEHCDAASIWRKAVAICSSENLLFFMLSLPRWRATGSLIFPDSLVQFAGRTSECGNVIGQNVHLMAVYDCGELTRETCKSRGFGMRASRIEDLDENSSTGGSISLSHDVFNVFFYSLFGNLESISDFFIGPSFCQMFND